MIRTITLRIFLLLSLMLGLPLISTGLRADTGACGAADDSTDRQFLRQERGGREAHPSPPQPPGRCAFRLNLLNNAGLSPAQMSIARDEVRRIFRAAGLDVIFNSAPAAVGSSYTIIIRPEDHPTRSDAPGWTLTQAGAVTNVGFVSTRALARIIREGENNRGLQLLGARPRNFAVALGRVVAHEAGHYLLQQQSHSERGAMQEGFRGRQWWSRHFKQTWRFTRQQAGQLAQRCYAPEALAGLGPPRP
ncbi:MAG TPA: hypothetical protein VNO70_05325 [Blastocatellia bacterium]|nr:hypothetical protein [Blastocatellia bacterium]